MDAIKVGIRVRPLIKREDDRGVQWVSSSNSVYEKGSFTPYYFDHVFGMDSTNSVIFDTLVEPIIQSVMEGFNGTVFAYGQTSSGKTHTMMGGESDAGVIPLSIARIFEYIQSHPEREFLMFASFMEIYNEKLTDLLNPENKRLKIREDSEHLVKVSGITEKNTATFEDIASLLRIGQSFRSVGETQLNERSSRSHTIFTLTVESKLKEETATEADGVVKVATLNLVDLAGSERATAAGTEGVRFKEGTFINLSLLTLGNVISKLSNGSSHVPFRDSKLTRILQSSLGGNAKTCIICTITPAEVAESHSTLKFASRAMTVKNRPKVNEVLVGEDALLKRVKSMELENIKLRKKLEEGLPADERHQLTIQLATAERDKNDLEKRLQALENYIKSSSSEKTEKKSHKQTSNRRMTVCCPGTSSKVEGSLNPWRKNQPLLQPESPLARRIKVLFPSGGGTGVGFSPVTKRGSLGEQSSSSYSSQVRFNEGYSEMDETCYVTTRKKRVSFLPTLVSTPMYQYHHDSLESMESGFQLVDAQVQTDLDMWPVEGIQTTEEGLAEKDQHLDQQHMLEAQSVEIQTEDNAMAIAMSMDECVQVGTEGSSACSMNEPLQIDRSTSVSFEENSVGPSVETIRPVSFMDRSVEVQIDMTPSSSEEMLRSQVDELTRELMAFKSEYAGIHSKLKNTQQECDEACIEAADLKRELLVLHRKLQLSSPSKFSAPSITLHSSLAVSSLGTVTPMDVQTSSSPEVVNSASSGGLQSEGDAKSEEAVESASEQVIEMEENSAKEKQLSVSHDSHLSQLSYSKLASTPALVSMSAIKSRNQDLSQISSVKMDATPTTVDSAPAVSLFSSSANTITPPSATMFCVNRVASSLRKRRAADLMSTLEFENEELKMVVEDSNSQREMLHNMIQDKDTKLKEYEDEIATLRTQMKDKESASVFQEELLVKLQSQLQVNQRKLEEILEKNRTLEEQLEENRSLEQQFSGSEPEGCNVSKNENMVQIEFQGGGCNLQDELMAAENDNHILEAEKLEEEIKQLQCRLDDKEEESQHLEFENKELKVHVEESRGQLEMLHTMIQDKDTKLKDYEDEMAILRTQIDDQESASVDLRVALESETLLKVEYHNHVQSLTEKMECAEKVSNVMRDLEAERDELRGNVQDLRAGLESETLQNIEYQNQVQSFKQKLELAEKVSDEVKYLEMERDELRGNVQDLRAALESETLQKVEIQSLNEKLVCAGKVPSEVKDLEAERDELRGNVQDLRAALESETLQNVEYQHHIQSLTEKMECADKVSNVVKDLEAEREELRGNVQDLRVALESETLQKVEYHSHVQSLTGKLELADKISNEMKDLEAEKDELRGKVQDLQTALESETLQNVEYQNQVQSFKQKLELAEKVSSEVKDLEAERDELRGNVQDLHAALESETLQNVEYQCEVQSLKQKLECADKVSNEVKDLEAERDELRGNVQDLRAALESETLQNKEYQNHVQSLAEKLECADKVPDEVKYLAAERDELRGNVQDLQTALESETLQNVEYQGQVQSLKQTLELADKVHSEVRDLEAEREELRGNVQDLRAGLESETLQNIEYQNQVQSFKQKLELAEKVSDEMRDLEAERDELRGNVQDLRAALESETLQNVEYQNYVQSLTEKMEFFEKVSNEMRDLEAERDELRGNVQDLRAALESETLQNVEYQCEVQSFKQKLECANKVSNEVKDLEAERDELRGNVQDLRAALESETLQNVEYQNHVQSLVEKLEFFEKVSNEVKDLEAERDELRGNVQDLRAALESETLQNVEYQCEVQSLKQKLECADKVSNEVKDLEAERDELRGNVRDLRAALESETLQNVEYQNHVQSLAEKLKLAEKLSIENENAVDEMQQKNQLLADQQEELDVLREEIFTLMDKLQTAEYEIECGAKIQDLKKEIQELKQKLHQQELSNQGTSDTDLIITRQTVVTHEVLQGSSNKENLEKARHQLELQQKEVPYYQPRLSKEANWEFRAYQLEQELKTVTNLYADVKKSYQAMTTVSKTSTEPVVDGSGAVTGMTFYHLKYELDLAKMEREEINKKYVKNLHEMKKEKAISLKLKNERNMFRIKYVSIKDACTCGAAKRMKEDVIAQMSSQSNSASDPSLSTSKDSASVSKEPSKALPLPQATSNSSSETESTSDSKTLTAQKFKWNEPVQDRDKKKQLQECKTQ